MAAMNDPGELEDNTAENRQAEEQSRRHRSGTCPMPSGARSGATTLT